MTNEEYRKQYKELTNKIMELTRYRQKLDMDYAKSESNRLGIHEGDIFIYNNKKVYVSCVFSKYGKVLVSLYLVNKNGKKGKKPYNSIGVDINKLVEKDTK